MPPVGFGRGRGATIVFFRAPIPWGATKVVFYKNKIRSLLCILKAFKRLKGPKSPFSTFRSV